MKKEILQKTIPQLYSGLARAEFSQEHIKYIKETKRIWISLDSEVDSYTLLINVKDHGRYAILKFEWTHLEKDVFTERETLSVTISDVPFRELPPDLLTLVNRLVAIAHSYKNNDEVELSPGEGGCWFCSKKITDKKDKIFDVEFDTWTHRSCLIEKFKEGNEEAIIMSYLLTPEERGEKV